MNVEHICLLPWGCSHPLPHVRCGRQPQIMNTHTHTHTLRSACIHTHTHTLPFRSFTQCSLVQSEKNHVHNVMDGHMHAFHTNAHTRTHTHTHTHTHTNVCLPQHLSLSLCFIHCLHLNKNCSERVSVRLRAY